MSDAPIGVVASGSGWLTVARMITARLPHEDVVALCDHAYAPWGRRPGRAVAMRVASLGNDLAAHGPKLVVLASAQGTLDALDALRAALAVPVVGMDGLVSFAASAAGAARSRWSPATAASAACSRGGACAASAAAWMRYRIPGPGWQSWSRRDVPSRPRPTSSRRRGCRR